MVFSKFWCQLYISLQYYHQLVSPHTPSLQLRQASIQSSTCAIYMQNLRQQLNIKSCLPQQFIHVALHQPCPSLSLNKMSCVLVYWGPQEKEGQHETVTRRDLRSPAALSKLWELRVPVKGPSTAASPFSLCFIQCMSLTLLAAILWEWRVEPVDLTQGPYQQFGWSTSWVVGSRGWEGTTGIPGPDAKRDLRSPPAILWLWEMRVGPVALAEGPTVQLPSSSSSPKGCMSSSPPAAILWGWWMGKGLLA